MDDDARSPPEIVATDARDAGGGDRNEADEDAAAEADDGVCAPKSMRDDDLVMFGVPLTTAADALKANRQ